MLQLHWTIRTAILELHNLQAETHTTRVKIVTERICSMLPAGLAHYALTSNSRFHDVRYVIYTGCFKSFQLQFRHHSILHKLLHVTAIIINEGMLIMSLA